MINFEEDFNEIDCSLCVHQDVSLNILVCNHYYCTLDKDADCRIIPCQACNNDNNKRYEFYDWL